MKILNIFKKPLSILAIITLVFQMLFIGVTPVMAATPQLPTLSPAPGFGSVTTVAAGITIPLTVDVNNTAVNTSFVTQTYTDTLTNVYPTVGGFDPLPGDITYLPTPANDMPVYADSAGGLSFRSLTGVPVSGLTIAAETNYHNVVSTTFNTPGTYDYVATILDSSNAIMDTQSFSIVVTPVTTIVATGVPATVSNDPVTPANFSYNIDNTYGTDFTALSYFVQIQNAALSEIKVFNYVDGATVTDLKPSLVVDGTALDLVGVPITSASTLAHGEVKTLNFQISFVNPTPSVLKIYSLFLGIVDHSVGSWVFASNSDAVFTVNPVVSTYTLTYTAGPGGTISGVSPQTVNSGANGTDVTALANTGYHFVSWSDGMLTANRMDTNVVTNKSLTANFAINTYMLTYTSGANGLVTGVSTQTVSYLANGSTVNAVPNAGYHFTDWSDGVLTATRTDLAVTGDISVTANFAVTTYNAYFNVDGLITTVPTAFGATIVVPPNLTKPGYTFAGWLPVVPATMPAANQTFVAQWILNNYTISFNSAGGSAVASIMQGYGTAVSTPPNPTKDGYIFTGWTPAVPATMPLDGASLTAGWSINTYVASFNVDGTITNVPTVFGATIVVPASPTRTGYTFTGWLPVPSTMPANDAIFVAQWSVNSYIANFVVDGVTTTVSTAFGSAIATPSNPTKPGYTFAGWLPIVPATMPAANQTFVAQWTLNNYTISFNSDGGSAVASISQGYGTAITAPADPIRAGYAFAAWSPVVPATMPAGGANLVAQWTINTYTASFEVDGTITNVPTVFGATITVPASPTKTGYTFAGWQPVPATMPAGNITFVAQWKSVAPTPLVNPSDPGNVLTPPTVARIADETTIGSALQDNTTTPVADNTDKPTVRNNENQGVQGATDDTSNKPSQLSLFFNYKVLGIRTWVWLLLLALGAWGWWFLAFRGRSEIK